MNVAAKRVVDSCHELTDGDRIDARYKEALVHRGRMPDHGLFWIMDEITGGRRLLDMAELEIVLLQAEAGPQAADIEATAA
ncbi:hypothetical protein NG701_16625 [Pseudarthrobacter sp. HLT3-5]|uniref:hypothetical protein n=1 Tax=Pseudarthrobacter cellobiosi TaxID=2953654 RepID=UPI00208E9A79|nr:hypothetical protein [Pseudarthrobacter sp. HLT3-5]MCO4276027.1 hypothetical protein [Pseudarthrobacter sp. HLT3-5]